MKIIKIHKPSDCIYSRIFDFCAPKVEVCSEDLDDFPKNCPLEEYKAHLKPPDALVCGWDNILPYVNDEVKRAMSVTTLRKKYGPEMFRRSVVFYMNVGNVKRRMVCGFVWRIQRFFYLKDEIGELGVCQYTMPLLMIIVIITDKEAK